MESTRNNHHHIVTAPPYNLVGRAISRPINEQSPDGNVDWYYLGFHDGNNISQISGGIRVNWILGKNNCSYRKKD